MHRIDTPTAQKDKFGAGKNGFTKGDPQTGTPATEIDETILDAMQEEICNVIEASGDSLDKNSNNQLLKAILNIIDICFPVGIPFPWPRAELPPSKYGITFLKWNGAAFSAEQYPKLAKVLPHLRLSDLRADYIIGWDDGRGVDVGRQLLSHRDGSFPAHSHGVDTVEAWDPSVWNSFGTGNDHSGDSIVATDNMGTLNGASNGILGLIRSGHFKTTASGVGTKVHPDSTAFLMIVRAS